MTQASLQKHPAVESAIQRFGRPDWLHAQEVPLNSGTTSYVIPLAGTASVGPCALAIVQQGHGSPFQALVVGATQKQGSIELPVLTPDGRNLGTVQLSRTGTSVQVDPEAASNLQSSARALGSTTIKPDVSFGCVIDCLAFRVSVECLEICIECLDIVGCIPCAVCAGVNLTICIFQCFF